MDYIFLPQSTSALDRWSDRAIRIVYWEIGLELGLVVAASSYFPKPSEFEYDHPPMNKIKLAVAVPTIFLPLGSCMTSWLPLFRRVKVRNFSRTGEDASTRVPAKPLTYSSFQILQLLACSFLAAHDFVILSARRPWFWLSLVGSFMPALAGTIYGLVGIARFLFSGSALLTLHRYHSPTTTEEYSDAPIENCALESAYQQQLSNGIRHPDLETNATAHEPGTARSQTPARDNQTRSRNPISPLTRPRFRWQEQSGARNGGRAFWTPIATTSSLPSIWGFYYTWLSRNAHHSPELIRQVALEAVAPLAISALSNAFLIFSLKKPLLTVIFTAFCFTILASAVWFLEFVYSVWCFFYYIRQISVGFNLTSVTMILVSFFMTWCHVKLVRCSVEMEWTPGYSSLGREYRLWNERRSEAGADAEVTVDGDL